MTSLLLYTYADVRLAPLQRRRVVGVVHLMASLWNAFFSPLLKAAAMKRRKPLPLRLEKLEPRICLSAGFSYDILAQTGQNELTALGRLP